MNGPDSFWYGDESNTPIEIEDDSIFGFTLYKGKLDVTLSDGAEWIYNANPSITALTLDGGIVNLQDEDIQNTYKHTYIMDADGQPILDANGKPSYTLSDYRKDVETDPHRYVDIGTLKGSGIFKADIDWSADSAKIHTSPYRDSRRTWEATIFYHRERPHRGE